MRALAILLLLTTSAFAQSKPAPQQRVWITEFAIISGRMEAIAPMAQLPANAKQTPLDLSLGVRTAAPFKSDTRYIRVVCEVECAMSTTGTATIGDIMVPRMHVEYFGVPAGSTLSVIAVP